MPDNIVINIPDYGSYSQEELQQQYGEDWLKAVDKLEGTVDIPDYGSYSYSDLKDAYGDDIPKALSQLSSKKKVQEEEEEPEPVQEEVQEDTESPSEDISLESSSTDEKPKEFKLPEVRSEEDELFKRSKGYYPGEQKSFYQNKEKEGAVATNDAFTEVSEYKGVFLDTSEEDLTDSLYEASDSNVRSDIAQAVSKKRTEELNTLADTFLDKKKKSIVEGIVEDNPEIEIGAAEAMASDSLFQETFKFGMSKLNLNEEDLATYKTDIENRSKDLKRRSELINKINKINSQINDVPIEQKKELLKERISIGEELKLLKESVALSDKKIAELRENEKGFTDAEGNVNQELKKKQEDIGKRVSGFEKEYKSDYNKIYARLAQEKAKMNALRESFINDNLTSEQSLSKEDASKIPDGDDSFLQKNIVVPLPSNIPQILGNFFADKSNPELASKRESYAQAYKEAEKNSIALSRLIFLNEDPAKVERGFGAVNPESEFYLPFQEELGQVVTSVSETFVKELGVDVDTDKEFREAAINIAQQENLTLTPEQIESGNASFPEKLGDGLGVSFKIGLDIALTRGIMGGASKLVSMPKYLARIQKLRNSPKLVKFIEGTTDVLLEGLSFELASESTDFAMGSAESLSNKGMDALVKRVSKSKLGKYFKFLDNYAGRFVKEVTGRASGGIIEEYTGDFVSEGVKSGFFTEEQFKNVFGEGEAGIEKFFLTLGTVGMMTVPTSIVTAAKKKAAGEEEGGELSKAIKRYEESLEINPTKENVAEGLEVLKEADSKVVEGITKEEEKVLTQKTKEDGKKEEVSIEDQKDGDVENEEEAESEQEVVQEEVLEPTSDTTTEEEVAEANKVLSVIEEVEEALDKVVKAKKKAASIDSITNPKASSSAYAETLEAETEYTKAKLKLRQAERKSFAFLGDKAKSKTELTKITEGKTEKPTTDTTTEEEVAEEEVLENDLDIPEVQKELTEDEVKINSVNSLVKEYNSSKNKNKKSKLFQEINSKSSNLNLTIKTKDNGKIELLNKSGKLVRSKSVKKKFKDQPESDVNAVKKAIEVGILSDVKNTDYILPGISSGDVLKGIRDFSRGKFNTEPAKALTIAFRNARNQNEIGLRDKFSNAVKSDPKSVSLEEFNQELELESEEVLADQASRQVPQEAQDLVVSSVKEFAKEEGIESKEEIEDLKDLMSFAETKTKSTTEETTTEESTTEEAVEEEVVEKIEQSFTKEEMTSKMDKTSLEKALEKVNALDNKLKNLSLSDSFLITPVARLLLAAVKRGMKVGISLEKAISNAKKQIVKSKEYKVLRKEDQNFIDNSSLDDIISIVEKETKGDSAKKKLLKNQGFSDSEIEQILLDFENKKKAAAAVKKATVKGKPTKTVVRKNTGQSAPPKISVTEKSIVKRIIQAQNKAGKQTLKNKVSLFRELAKELGYKVIPKNINTRKAISLMRELNGLDATNSKKVKSFVERLDKTLSDTEESNRKSELSKRVKRISKLGKKTKGVRSDIANRLKNLNLNKIEDIETYNKLVQALEDSFKIKESMAEKSITPESLDAINKLEQEQEQTNEMILKDSYENSVLKAQGLTFEEYKHIQKRAGENAALALKKQALDTKQKNLQEKIDEFNNQIERFEAYADSVDSQDVLSESYKEAVRKLRKALKGVDVNSLSDSNINSIYNATEEMINYDSPAGVTQITNILIGSKKGQSLFTYSKSKGGIFSKTGSLAWKGLLNTNWENFISGVTKKISYAQEFTAKLMAEWDTAQAKANSRVTPLEERLNTISERKKGFVNIGVDSNGFQKIGVVSELLQHDSGITEQEIEQDFKDKKQDIKKNILVDRRIMKSSLKYSPEYNAASRRSKILQETLDTVNKYDSKADLQAAVDKGEILSKPELEYFNTVKEMFAELQPELRESLYMNTGQDLKMVENYTPTYKKTYSKVSDIETGSYGSTLSSSQSTGRTIQRVKPTGNTYNNYDFRETSLSGLRDVISDIETLPAKAQTNAVLNSKGYNKMFPKGSSLQASIESYLENIAKARESRSPADFSQQNRVSNAMRNLYSSLVAIPLKNTGQYIKQTVPIVTNTVFVNGVKKVSQAIMLMNSKDPAIQAKLEEAYSRSQTKNRTTLGDAQLDKSKSLMAKLLKNAYSPEGKGNIVSKGYYRLVEGALSIGDTYAARLTFVSSMLVELEKQGIDFDSDISNETISKADFTTNQINNTSDYTKTKQAFKGKSKNDKIIKDLLFLYKSFAMNQSATIANAIPKILRGDRQAIGLAVGSSVGLYTFHLIATMMRSAEKDLAEYLFGFNDDEIIDLVSGRSRKKRKKLFDKKDTKEEREREKLFSDIGNKTIVDFITGWMPGIVDNLVKRSINLLADQFVSENRRLELEDMGIKKEDFIKIYDQDPGVLGLLSGQTGDVVNAISIIRNPDLDEKFKKPAYALLTSLILQEGNINKISKKLIYQSVKADKAIRKELNK